MVGGQVGNINSDKIMKFLAWQALKLRLYLGGDKKDEWKKYKQTSETFRFTFGTDHYGSYLQDEFGGVGRGGKARNSTKIMEMNRIS